MWYYYIGYMVQVTENLKHYPLLSKHLSSDGNNLEGLGGWKMEFMELIGMKNKI